MLSLILVIVHVLGAVVWIGGTLFVGLVLTPVLRDRPPAERSALFGAVGRRFLTVGWAGLGALVLSGPILWAMHGYAVSPVFAAKLSLVGVILFLSVVHDFFLGPRLVALLKEGSHHDEILRLRRRVALLARLNALCAIVVLILGSAMSRGF